jgi:DNA-binding FadR family transcriptional regulator
MEDIKMAGRNSAILPRQRARSLVQEVLDSLTARIHEGIYRPGERFPTEPEVMAEQGVSRGVVREAMSRLRAAGLVEVRHGVGTFVLPGSATTPPLLDLTTVVTIRDVVDMLELRVSLEAEAAALAAARRTKPQLALMQSAIDAFALAIDRGANAADEDFEFHLQIARATGNKYFEDVYRHLGKTTIPRTRIDTAHLLAAPGTNYLRQSNAGHQMILDAIVHRDASAARAAMRQHLTFGSDRLKRVAARPDKLASVAAT